MTYREFINRLCKMYKFSNELIDIYNEAFQDDINKDFSQYWKKFITEYASSERAPMPSFWLKEEGYKRQFEGWENF